MNYYNNGIMWVIINIVVSTLMNSSSRLLFEEYNVSELQVIFMIYCFTASVSLLYLLFSRKSIKFSFMKLHFLRAFIFILAQILILLAYNSLPFPHVTALGVTYPLISTVGAAFFLKETLKKYRWVSLFLGSIGSLVIIGPGHDHFSFESFYVLLAVVFWAITDIITKVIYFRRQDKNEVAYFFVCNFIISSLMLLIFPQSHKLSEVVYEPRFLLLISLIAFLSYIFIISFFWSIENIDVSKIVPLYFFSVVLGSILGYLVFDEMIRLNTAIGIVIVLFANLYMLWRDAREFEKLSSECVEDSNDMI